MVFGECLVNWNCSDDACVQHACTTVTNICRLNYLTKFQKVTRKQLNAKHNLKKNVQWNKYFLWKETWKLKCIHLSTSDHTFLALLCRLIPTDNAGFKTNCNLLTLLTLLYWRNVTFIHLIFIKASVVLQMTFLCQVNN